MAIIRFIVIEDKMTLEEQRKFDKENEQLAQDIVGKLKWYQSSKIPNKACVLVEDILPIIVNYVSKERLYK